MLAGAWRYSQIIPVQNTHCLQAEPISFAVRYSYPAGDAFALVCVVVVALKRHPRDQLRYQAEYRWKPNPNHPLFFPPCLVSQYFSVNWLSGASCLISCMERLGPNLQFAVQIKSAAKYKPH